MVKDDAPRAVKIKQVVEENPHIRTFFLDTEVNAEPGQFMMLWIPGLDEKPFSLSYIGKPAGITVEKKGAFTAALFKLKAGDHVGIRGPYGKGFKPKGKACIVGGGCGIAPVAPLAEKLKYPVVIIGARSKDRLFFLNRFDKPLIATDDGSCGSKCFTTELLERVLEKKGIKTVYTCGPEIMMRKVFDLCERYGAECQASMERYVKCGLGVCGQCEVNGFMICKDGPVFSSSQLRRMPDFGKSARLKSGKKVSINEYARGCK